MNRIQERSTRILSLEGYQDTGLPVEVKYLNLNPPKEPQYVLRMLIQAGAEFDPNSSYHLPRELHWTAPMIWAAILHQEKMGIFHPFIYITVRHGPVISETDDEWHVDGFSTKTSHVPEQNYIWSSVDATEFAPLKVNFPEDFDPRVHNINEFLARHIVPENLYKCDPHVLYCADPYMLHRRPKTAVGITRTFVRVSFVPVEIEDIHNTQNPMIPRNYTHDGVAFRNTLSKYG